MSISKLSASSAAAAAGGGAPGVSPDLYNRCKAALEEALSYNVKTYQKCLPCTEAYNFTLTDLEPLYAKHGPKLLEFMDLSSQMGVLRPMVKAKILEHGSHTLRSWAIFSKTFQIGACDELSSIVLSSDHVAPLHGYRVIVQGAPKLSGSTDDHVALAFSEKPISPETFSAVFKSCANEIFSSFHKLPGVVIVDPYLEKVLTSEQILADIDYRRKLVAMQNVQVRTIQPMKDYMQLKAGASAALASFQTDLASLRAIPLTPLANAEKFVSDKRIELGKTHLGRLFAGTTWKCAKASAFWTSGPHDAMKPVCDRLLEMGIEASISKVKDKEEHVVQIPFASYQILARINRILLSS